MVGHHSWFHGNSTPIPPKDTRALCLVSGNSDIAYLGKNLTVYLQETLVRFHILAASHSFLLRNFVRQSRYLCWMDLNRFFCKCTEMHFLLTCSNCNILQEVKYQIKWFNFNAKRPMPFDFLSEFNFSYHFGFHSVLD